MAGGGADGRVVWALVVELHAGVGVLASVGVERSVDGSWEINGAGEVGLFLGLAAGVELGVAWDMLMLIL